MHEDNILLSRTARKTAGYFLLALVSLVMVFPFLWLIFLTFKSNAEIWTEPFNLPKTFDLRNYAQAIKIMDVPMFFRNSVIVAAGAVTLSFFATFLSSYALARMTFRMKQSIYYVFLSGFAVPIFILLWPLFLITKAFHMINTFWSLILPYAAGNIAFNTLLLVGQLRSFPKEIEEAAIIDGAGILRVLFRIVAPIMQSSIVTFIVFNTLGSWNEFPLAVVMIMKEKMRTVPLAISLFKEIYAADMASMTAALVIIIVPQLIFYGVFQKYIIKGMISGAIKG
jgi:raffinose/stachyose/melibiose transport system permease protein